MALPSFPGEVKPTSSPCWGCLRCLRALSVSSTGKGGRFFQVAFFRDVFWQSVRFIYRSEPKSIRKHSCRLTSNNLTALCVSRSSTWEEYGISSQPWFHISEVRIGLTLDMCRKVTVVDCVLGKLLQRVGHLLIGGSALEATQHRADWKRGPVPLGPRCANPGSGLQVTAQWTRAG